MYEIFYVCYKIIRAAINWYGKIERTSVQYKLIKYKSQSFVDKRYIYNDEKHSSKRKKVAIIIILILKFLNEDSLTEGIRSNLLRE